MPRGSNSGGKRPGAGHPSNARKRSVVPWTDEHREKARIALDAQREVIQPRQLLAVRLRAQGYSWPRVAEKVGVVRATVTTWRKAEWWDEEFAKAAAAVAEEADKLFRERLGMSLEVGDKLIEDFIDEKEGADAGLALKAAINYQDRAVGKPIIRSQSLSRKDIHITYEEIPPALEEPDDDN